MTTLYHFILSYIAFRTVTELVYDQTVPKHETVPYRHICQEYEVYYICTYTCVVFGRLAEKLIGR